MSGTNIASPYLTTKELAAILRTTPRAVLMMRHRGKAPRGFRRGKQVLYLRSDVEAWMKEQIEVDRLGQRAAA